MTQRTTCFLPASSYLKMTNRCYYVDIPEFWKFVHGMSRGDFFREINFMVKSIDKDWELTYLRNSNQSYMKFYDMMQKLHAHHGVKHCFQLPNSNKKFRNAGKSRHMCATTQAWDDIVAFPSRVSNLIDEATIAAQNVSAQAMTLGQMLDHVNTIVAEFKQCVAQKIETIKKQMEIFLFIVRIWAVCHILNKKENRDVKTIIAVMTLILPTITDGIQNVVSGLIRAIERISGPQTQELDDDSSFISSFFSLTVGVIKGLFTDVPKDAFDNMSLNSKKVKLVSDYIRGATTIYEFLCKIVGKFMEIIGDKLMKYYGVLPWFMKDDEISPLIDEFVKLKEERHDTKCVVCKESALKVIRLYERVFKMEATMQKKVIKHNQNAKILPYMRIMLKTLEGLVNRIPEHFRSGLVPRRTKPFWVYIYGEPRVGKSAVVQPYIVNVLAKALGLISSYEDYTNYTYLRNCGDEYWEGYDGHPVLWYNDIFQNYAQEEAMHKAVLELTNIVDDNVYPLNMAFERKHNVYFSSELVISNAQAEMINQTFLTNKCWSGGAHLYARRNVCIELQLNNKYRHPTGVGISDRLVQQEMLANPHRCVGYEFVQDPTNAEELKQKLLFPEDMYWMNFTDPVTQALQGTYNLRMGMAKLSEIALKYKESQGIFKDKLYNHFERMFAQAGDDDDVYYDAISASPFTVNAIDVTEAARAQIEQLFPELLGCTSWTRTGVVRRSSDEEFNQQFVWTWQGMNSDLAADNTLPDARMRIILAIDIIGAEVWAEQYNNMSYVQKLKLKIIQCWNNIKNNMDFIFKNLPDVATIQSFLFNVATVYMLYRITKFYYNLADTGIATVRRCLIPEKVDMSTDTACDAIDADAQTAEGSIKPAVRQIVRKKMKKDASVATVQAYDTQNVNVENIVKNQLCKVNIEVYDDQGVLAHNRTFGSALCVGSDIFLLPRHFVTRWQDMDNYYRGRGTTIKLSLAWNDTLKQSIEWSNLDFWFPDYEHSADIAFMRIKNLVQKQHIKKFFLSTNDKPTLYDVYLYGYRASSTSLHTLHVDGAEYTSVEYKQSEGTDPLYGGKFQERMVYAPMCLQYWNCLTTAGDCGLLVFNCDSSLNCRKIMGMHTGGTQSCGYGIGNIVYKEDIEEAFEHFYGKSCPIRPVAMAFQAPNEDRAQPLKDMGLLVCGQLPRLVEPAFGVDRVPVVTLPRRSKISKSVVFDVMEKDFGLAKTAPARLRPFEKDGEKISPMLLGIRKIAVVSPVINVAMATQIKNHMLESISSWRSPYTPRVLTDFEAVNGTGLLNPIEMSTSAGYPYVFLDNTAGKHPFFKVLTEAPKTFEMGPYLKSQFDLRINMAKQGLIKETYFIDTLKDETRPLEKVVAGKTRVFQIGPVDLNIALRKYFGAFINHMQATYIEGESAIGINANSTEWTTMIKKQQEIAIMPELGFLNGDGKNFDASAGQVMAMDNLEVINEWYDDGDENKLIRRVLYATFFEFAPYLWRRCL